MTAYVDIAYAKLVGHMLPDEIDAVESGEPGFVAANALAVSALADSILVKRYATPFASAPETLKFQVAQLLIQRIWRRHGSSPTNTDKSTQIDESAAAAMAWLRDAANSKDGLVELPLRDSAGSGVVAGGPLSYSEQSPYTWADLQVQAGTQEDANGGR